MSASADATEWERFAPYLDRALDLEPDDCDHWLDELSVTRPEVAVFVRKLLKERDDLNANGFLTDSPLLSESDKLVSELAKILKQNTASRSSDWLRKLSGFASEIALSHQLPGVAPGAVFGTYRLIREIGQGGMSTVWLAERCDGQLKREVALKLPYAGPQRLRIVERFQRERDILATLTHTNIARIYDAGVSESGQPYLAIEYVEGTSLISYCDGASLTLPERLEVFRQVLAAVQFAHGQLVIHRDLKPSNILVTASGRVVLLDFGIAKLLSDSEGESHLTQMAGRPLTPDYASPEQVAAQPLGTASDVYSLGVVLYELLTGTRPYRPKRSSHGALEESILSDIPQKPSQVIIGEAQAIARGGTARALAKLIEGDLDTIVLKALKKSPNERYHSVDAFSQDVHNYLHSLPVSARPDSNWYRLIRFVARHKLTVSATAVALIGVVGGSAIAIRQAHMTAVERDRALALVSRNEAISEFTETLINEAAASEKPVSVSDMLAQSEKFALADTRDKVENRAAILSMVASRYYSLGNYGKAAQLFEHSSELLENSSDKGLRSEVTCEYASAISSMGKTQEAIRLFDRELTTLQGDSRVESNCYLFRASIAIRAGDAAGALRYSTVALERYRDAGRISDEGVFLGTLAYSYHLNGNDVQANRYFEQAVEEFKRLGRERTSNATSVRSNWANVSLGAGMPKQALAAYDEILGEVAVGESSKQPLPALIYNRAHALELIGRYAEAHTAYEYGLQLATEGKDMLLQVHCLLSLALLARQAGNTSAAQDLFNRGTALLSPSYAADNPVVLKAAYVRGRLALAAGEFEAARIQFKEVLARKKTGLTSFDARLGSAEVALSSADPSAAVQEARTMLTAATAMQGGLPYSNFVGLSWLALGRALQKQDEHSEAHKALESAVTNLSNTVDADNAALVLAQKLVNDSG